VYSPTAGKREPPNRSSAGTTTGYYTNNLFPTTNNTPLAYEYYDDYDLKQTGSANYTYASQGLPGEVGATTAQIKGMPTMVWKTTVGSGLSGTWLLSVTFYDKNLHVIQTQSNNHLYYVNSTTLTDTATSVPDFLGVPQINKVKKQSAAAVSIKVQTNITYDQVYRVTAVDQYYNGSTTVSHVAAYSYNELGQVIKKGLGYVSSTTWLQNVNMRYNLHGQLLYINNSRLANDTGKTSNDTNDLFGMQMIYDQVDSKLSNTPYYNGKLSAVKWMNNNNIGHSMYERSYKFSYDGIDRYVSEAYGERLSTSGTGASYANLGGWDEKIKGYDVNGNILGLTRYLSAQGGTVRTLIDSLTYTYSSTTSPNQLYKITDAAGNSNGFGVLTGGNAAGNYTYDGNGNLTSDPYKALGVTYDVLNRTDKITMTGYTNRYINYTYDASGTLIRKQAYDNNVLQHTTDYIDGFVYLDNTLLYFAMPEGRVLNVSGTLTQEYVISDQQGNARLSFQNNGSGTAVVTQENSYYGFGMILPNSVITTPTNDNKHLYNGGSEWQNDFSNLPNYYQTFNRNYDAAIGRFVGVDPQAESAASMTSYQYARNNPIMLNDPLGNKFGPPIQGNGQPFYANDDYQNAEADDEMSAFAYNSFVQNLISLAEGGAGTISKADGNSPSGGSDDSGSPSNNSGAPSTGAAAEFAVGAVNSNTTINMNAIGPDKVLWSIVDNPNKMSYEDEPDEGVTWDNNISVGGDPYSYAGNLYHIPGNNLPLNNGSNRQHGNTCAFCSISGAQNFYGGHTTGQGVFHEYIISNDLHGSRIQNIVDYGIDVSSGKLFNEFLNGYFSSDVIGGLLNGDPVLGTFLISPTQAHEVLITGFSYFLNGPNAGFNYTYWNPATGTYGNKSPAAFYDTFVVTGSK